MTEREKRSEMLCVSVCAFNNKTSMCQLVNWFFSIFRVCITINIGCVSVLQVQLVQSYMFCLEFIFYTDACALCDSHRRVCEWWLSLLTRHSYFSVFINLKFIQNYYNFWVNDVSVCVYIHEMTTLQYLFARQNSQELRVWLRFFMKLNNCNIFRFASFLG